MCSFCDFAAIVLPATNNDTCKFIHRKNNSI
jgi:hypothetical protein